MCGIAGIISSKKITKKAGESFLSCLAHRGPDDSGIFLHGGVLLAQTRLSIIDTSSAGHQPMTYTHKGKSITLVYNGEIYNYKTLKATLKKKGYHFDSESDSEVLCAMYLEYGDACVAMLDGMFAFVIFDHSEQTLFGAVDRFGQKPLYYIEKNESFIFGSEVKALLDFVKTPEVDFQAISLFLTLGYIPAPYTGFSGIKKIEPGTMFSIGKNLQFHQKSYYSLISAYNPKRSTSKDTIRLLLDEAVKKRLVADVPVGTFLSGGVDSTLVTAIAKKYKNNLHTFSISFSDKKHDESLFATIASKRLQTAHHARMVTAADMQAHLGPLTAHMDVPFADPSLIPTYLLSTHARAGVTVALSGDAGDESFGGYDKYRAWYMVSRLPAVVCKVLRFAAKFFPRKIGQVCTNTTNTLSDQYVEVTNFFTKEEKRQLLDPQWYAGDALHSYKETFDAVDMIPVSLPQKLMMLDFLFYIPGNIHPKVDMASMKASLEVRAPFIDHTVVEAALHLPLSEKIQGKQGKLLLKDFLLEWFPASFIYRKKHGFTLPLESWLPKEIDWKTLEKLHIRKQETVTPYQRYALYVLANWYSKHFS